MVRHTTMARHTLLPVLVVGTALTLSACGTSPGCRAITGAGLGAAGGAIGGALVGVPLTGALIGAAGGAAIGGLTSPNQVNAGPAPCD